MRSWMTVGKKLALCVGAFMFVVLGMGLSSLYSTMKLGELLSVSTKSTGLKRELLGDLRANVNLMRMDQRGRLLYTLLDDKDWKKRVGTDFAARHDKAMAALNQMKPLLLTARGKELTSSIEGDLILYRKYFEEMTAICEKGKVKDAVAFYRAKTSPMSAPMEKKVQELTDLTGQMNKDDALTGDQSIARARWTAVVLALISIVVGILVSMVILGINKSLRTVTRELAEGASQIASAAQQVASSSQSLAQGASEQASSLQQTSTASEDVTSMTQKNAASSASATNLMATVDKCVADGNRSLGEMVDSMDGITSSSDKISKINRVIDEIAFQTNILALNAAVEAARAGEAGMGFAVVADEVRSLAQRSAQAAKDTAALIEESISKSHEGSAKLQQVAEVISAITESSTQVRALVDEVNSGSQEQTREIESISRSIAEMDRVTQSNAASAEESAAASQELSAQARALNLLVEQLQAMVGTEALV